MADKRSGIIQTVQWREAGTGGGFTKTDLIGEGITVERAENKIPLADGTIEKAGSAVRLTIPVLDPALFAALDTFQDDAKELEVVIEFWEGPDNTAIYDDLGFTVTPVEPGEVGQLEGFTIDAFIYGLSDADYLVLSEALGGV